MSNDNIMREIKFRAWDNIVGRFKTGIEASLPYKLEPDGIYLIEVKEKSGFTKEDAANATNYYFKRHRIDIQFIFTNGDNFMLQAVPGIKRVKK